MEYSFIVLNTKSHLHSFKENQYNRKSSIFIFPLGLTYSNLNFTHGLPGTRKSFNFNLTGIKVLFYFLPVSQSLLFFYSFHSRKGNNLPTIQTIATLPLSFLAQSNSNSSESIADFTSKTHHMSFLCVNCYHHVPPCLLTCKNFCFIFNEKSWHVVALLLSSIRLNVLLQSKA